MNVAPEKKPVFDAVDRAALRNTAGALVLVAGGLCYLHRGNGRAQLLALGLAGGLMGLSTLGLFLLSLEI